MAQVPSAIYQPLAEAIQRPNSSHDVTKPRASMKISRPQTATGSFRPDSINESVENQTKKFAPVQSYTSPRLEGLWPPESSQRNSVFDARSLQYPKTKGGAQKFDKHPELSGMNPSHLLLDPSLNLRSPSLCSDFRVNSDNPVATLVTQMPLPQPPAPSNSSTKSTSPSDEGNLLRKQIEAALRMYPRNTWGPVTKWGYLEELPPGKRHQREHFLNNPVSPNVASYTVA
jgi:hypothetical protein